MSELKWETNADKRRSWNYRSGAWSISLTAHEGVFWLMFRSSIVKIVTSVDAAKQLAQRIEDVLDPPECPEVKRYGIHWTEVIDSNGDGTEFKFCPMCGQRLGEP